MGREVPLGTLLPPWDIRWRESLQPTWVPGSRDMSQSIPPMRAPEIPSEQTPPPAAAHLTGQEAYNLVTDTVVGPNVRLSDNLLQAVAIGICTLIGAGIGAIAVGHLLAGAMIGGFCGMVIGLFASGIFLMIYRAVMHVS